MLERFAWNYRIAIFEWQDDSPSTAAFSAALSAKFRNRDQILFSVLRDLK